MSERLVNDFSTELTAELAVGAGGGSPITVANGVPTALVGAKSRIRVGEEGTSAEIILVEFTTATGWTVVTRAVEDATRFPAVTHPIGTPVAAVLTVDGFSAIIGTGRTLWVDDINGNDTTAIPGQIARPYKTVTAAMNAAVAGDVIQVLPGLYTTVVSLAKHNVKWNFHNGTTVQRSDTAGAGIWDDGGSAVTCVVTGRGTFNRIITTGGGNHNLVKVTHANSVFHIDCLDLIGLKTGPANGSDVVAQTNGRLVINCRDLDDDTTGSPSSTSQALIWSNGFMSINGRVSRGQVWTGVFNTPTGGDMHMTFDEITSRGSAITLYDNGTQSTAAAWIHCKTLRNGLPAGATVSKAGNVRLYVTCQKFFGTIALNSFSESLQSANFNTPGAHSFIPPARVTYAEFTLNGSSGGGGGSNDTVGGGGGGGGGQAISTIAVTPLVATSVVVGAGGDQGGVDGDGGTGGDTTVAGGLIFVTGGQGGTSGTNGGQGGAGGSASGQQAFNGNPGSSESGGIGGAGGSPGGTATAVGGSGTDATPGGNPGNGGANGDVSVQYLDVSISGGLFYLKADKGVGKIDITGGHDAWIEVADLDGNGTFTPAIRVTSFEADQLNPHIIDIRNTTIRNANIGVKVDNCTVRLRNVLVDTTSRVTGNPIEVTTQGRAELLGVNLLAFTGRHSITAPSPKTVVAIGTIAINTTLSPNITIEDRVIHSTIVTPVQLTTSQNDWDPGNARIWRVSASTNINITGMKAPVIVEDRVKNILNIGPGDLTFPHESGSSTDINRWLTHTGASVTIQTNKMVGVLYDPVTERWRLFS